MILALVVLQIIRCIALVTETNLVDDWDSALPVSSKNVTRSRAVDLILPSGKVPHEIAPVHPVHLVVEEEAEILPECRFLVLGSGHLLSTPVHVRLIESYVLRVGIRPHPREKHFSGRFVFDFTRAVCLYVFASERSPVFCGFDFIGSIEILAINQRRASILLTAEVADERESIVRLVLVSRGLGI